MSDAARAMRAKARASWPVVRHALADDPSEVLRDVAPAVRIAMVWALTVDAWAMSGHPLPTYRRADAPGRLFRPGEPADRGDC